MTPGGGQNDLRLEQKGQVPLDSLPPAREYKLHNDDSITT